MDARTRYDKANTRGLYLKLNIRTDADILSHLAGIENRQGYLKGLIRADMGESETQQNEAPRE